MAHITFKPNHSNHQVLLDDNDRFLLVDAIKRKQANGFTAERIAKDLGFGRTYLYALASSYVIELTRFAQIQRYFQLQLLTTDEVEVYLSSIRNLLLPTF